ncbi:phosphonate ABC transporter, permease protein PhnE [Rhodobacteraceae bacterium WD3A24]|nr:phosphonate ABC transporter, permease protein PhnE [Rhodobacteraceae bacterium WD3A24]
MTRRPALAPELRDDLLRERPRLFGPTPGDWALRAAAGLVILAVLGFSLWRVDATPERIAEGIGRLGFLLQFMWPPTAGGELWRLVMALLETLAIALIGTVAAAVASYPIGFLGARNILRMRLLRLPLRRALDVIRGVDVLIFALIFVAAVGLGPFAGILAVAVNDVGNFSKLFAEAIENTDDGPAEGAAASGCSRLETIRFAIVPQVMPVILSHILYFFERNVRAASIIGIVGAGGIGFELSERIRGNYWDEAAFIILMLLVTVMVIDRISHRLRLRIIGR